MTRIALIAILIPTLVYSTEAVSAPILYRSQGASSNVNASATNQVRRRVAAPTNAVTQSVASNSNPASSNQESRPRVVPTTNELPQIMAANIRMRGSANQQKTNALFQNPDLIPLGYEVFTKETFQEYMGASFSAFNPGSAFKIETAPTPKQTPFKVTLVGVNINAWLENPDMHQDLIKAAERFPVPRLLDNLVQNNPELTFNNPQLTERILNTDIYSPYLSNITSPPKLPPLFTKYRTAVAYTRNYNIYGASAGGFPYFGAPTEGTDRRINLSVNRHQFREYAVRFPDTDIFLVVTINISPNWLEESWDIRQENRQFADIFIYAFNRKGKLLGGSGVSQSFLKKGQFITLSQRVYSKYWQSAIPRVFYITPSFKIVNTAVPGSRRAPPSHEVELSRRPYLNSTQRYILASIENLRDIQHKPEVQLFNEDGNRTYKHVIPPNKVNSKPFLAHRKFILNVDDTNFMPVFNYPAKVLAELDGSASFPIQLIPVRETNIKPKASTNTNTSRRRDKKAEASVTNITREITNIRENVRRVATPVSIEPNQARQQGVATPTNTNSQVLTPRTNLPATNQGAPRRAPSSTNSNINISNVGASASVSRRRRATPTANKPVPVPLQSCTQSAEYLAHADTSLMLDCAFHLTIEEIELKAQNAATSTNQARQQKATNNAQQTIVATNTNQRGASIAALEEKNTPKATKTSRKAKKSPTEQLQETEDKIQEAREKKFTKDQAKLKKAMGVRRYFPSNEADKLKEMIDVVSERLKEAPYFTTNDLQAVTNSIPAFELETDPAVYRSERKKYYSIPVSVSRFKKEFTKETKMLKSARAARLDDEIYWDNLHRKILIENNKWTPSLETQHLEFQKQHRIRKKMEIDQLVYQRNSLFFQVISNEIQSYLDRSQKYVKQTVKPKKQLVEAAKLQKQADTLLAKSTGKYRTPAYANKVLKFQETYSNTSLNFITFFDEYVLQKPRDLTIPLLQTNDTNTQEQIKANNQKWTGLSRINRVPMQLVVFAEMLKENYPTKVYRAKMRNAARREYKRNMRFIVYEGYIFVLSGRWKVKTSLADRLDVL